MGRYRPTALGSNRRLWPAARAIDPRPRLTMSQPLVMMVATVIGGKCRPLDDIEGGKRAATADLADAQLRDAVASCTRTSLSGRTPTLVRRRLAKSGTRQSVPRRSAASPRLPTQWRNPSLQRRTPSLHQCPHSAAGPQHVPLHRPGLAAREGANGTRAPTVTRQGLGQRSPVPRKLQSARSVDSRWTEGAARCADSTHGAIRRSGSSSITSTATQCDNLLENLRILCPNCHSQTETWCGRRRPA